MPVSSVKAVSVQPKQTLSPERRAFWTSKYTNADAEVVKNKLGLKTLDAAKEHIGTAILTKKESGLKKLGVTKETINDKDLAAFTRSQFTQADVEKARKSFDFLKGAPKTEVESYLGLKLTNATAGYQGGMEMLAAHGITESKYDRHDRTAAFKSAGLTDKHVATAKAKYDFLKSETNASIKEYLGLKVLNAAGGYDFAKDFLKDIGAAKGWGS